MKVSISQLTDTALDFAVAKCLNPDWDDEDLVAKVTTFDEFDGTLWNFSTDWSQAGPIIEMVDMTVTRWDDYPNWTASAPTTEVNRQIGDTPLIAAMRCYVSYNFGHEVEIPEELL